uniref:Uncharacterized protein n=1 Tax=viral metagenome TaxID=1070528 RepID=A0A6C0K1D5_9ZZZZ
MTELLTIAVAIYIGATLYRFFEAVTHDIVSPVIGGFFPGAEKSVDGVVITVGSAKIKIGAAIGAAVNLGIAFLVVSMTLPHIKKYAPVGGYR